MSIFRTRLASLLTVFAVLGLFGASCGGGGLAPATCEDYRDDAIERRLDRLSLPDVDKNTLEAELEKHRVVMLKVHGERLIKECQHRREGTR